MPLSEDFTNEINTAVEQSVTDCKTTENDNKIEQTPDNNATDDDNSRVKEGVKGSSGDGEISAISNEDDKAEDKVIEAKAAEDTVQSKGSTVSDYALAQAIQAGFSISEAREFGSDKVLMRAIEMVRAVAEKTVPKQEEKKEDSPLNSFPVLDPEKYEPEVIKTFEVLKTVIEKQQEAIKGFQEYTRFSASQQQEVAAREVEQWFDTKVNSLGKDFEDALGSGNYSALDRASPQFAKREEIANQAAILLAGYKAAGQQAPPRDDIFNTAAKFVLADEFQRVREKKLSDELSKRSTQHINRVGGKEKNNNKNPLDETANLLDEKYFKK